MTTYAGVLVNVLNVLFIDTISFIADIPTTLIETFYAKLNDAVNAHLIIHICDRSHRNYVIQQKTMIETLLELDVRAAELESMIII